MKEKTLPLLLVSVLTVTVMGCGSGGGSSGTGGAGTGGAGTGGAGTGGAGTGGAGTGGAGTGGVGTGGASVVDAGTGGAGSGGASGGDAGADTSSPLVLPTTIELSEADRMAFGSHQYLSCVTPPIGSKVAKATQTRISVNFNFMRAGITTQQYMSANCMRPFSEDIPEADAKALYAERYLSTLYPYSAASQNILKEGENRDGKIVALSRAADGTYIIVADAEAYRDDPEKSYFTVKVKGDEAFAANLCTKFLLSAKVCSALAGDSAANRAKDFTGAPPIKLLP